MASSLNQMATDLAQTNADLLTAERQIAHHEISEWVLLAVPDAIAVVGEEDRLVTATHNFYKIFKLVQEKSQGQPLSKIVELGWMLTCFIRLFSVSWTRTLPLIVAIWKIRLNCALGLMATMRRSSSGSS